MGLELRRPFASLEGSTAVVTGGARGIGHEVARTFLSVGMHVVILDRDRDPLELAVDELSEVGAVSAVRCDLSIADDFPKVDQALRLLPPLRVWVNNAGVVSHQDAQDVDPETFERVMRDNASSVLRGSQTAYRHMIDQGQGSIINLTSLAVDKVMAERLTYASSKAAVVSITRYCAQDWGLHGIRVNAIAPGFIQTRLTTWAADDPREIVKQETLSRIAARQVGQPADIARAALFLASDLAAYVTGDILYVDGGWHLV